MNDYLTSGRLQPDNTAFCDAFKELVFSMLDNDPRLVLGDADLGRAMYGAEYKELKAARPGQMYDAGIAEANMVGVAAGLAVLGRVPIIHTFAAFATRRVFDTLFISGAYSGLSLNVVGGDPGITSTHNGGTHTTFEDIGLMRSIPNSIVFEPADNTALREVFPQLVAANAVTYMRLPRKIQPVQIYPEGTKFALGRAKRLRDGTDATVIALGTELPEALKAAERLAAEGISLRVLDPVTVTPLDQAEVLLAARETGAIVTAENHSVKTGLFAEISGFIVENHPCPIAAVGLRNEFGEVGGYDELLCRFKLTAEDIAVAVRRCIARKKSSV